MRTLLTLVFCMIASASFAAPRNYDVKPDTSNIGFTYTFGGKDITGAFPDYNMNIAIDFEAVKNSRVDVTLNSKTATGGFVFGTQAMRSKKILSANEFPEIRFVSTSVTGGGNTAKIKGNVTVRGITKPLTLTATLFREAGTDASEREDLILRITGTLNRFDFGASGYADEVGPDLNIKIKADIIQRK
jgi:polyisoprenoid-binding protein YceI